MYWFNYSTFLSHSKGDSWTLIMPKGDVGSAISLCFHQTLWRCLVGLCSVSHLCTNELQRVHNMIRSAHHLPVRQSPCSLYWRARSSVCIRVYASLTLKWLFKSVFFYWNLHVHKAAAYAPIVYAKTFKEKTQAVNWWTSPAWPNWFACSGFPFDWHRRTSETFVYAMLARGWRTCSRILSPKNMRFEWDGNDSFIGATAQNINKYIYIYIFNICCKDLQRNHACGRCNVTTSLCTSHNHSFTHIHCFYFQALPAHVRLTCSIETCSNLHQLIYSKCSN